MPNARRLTDRLNEDHAPERELCMLHGTHKEEIGKLWDYASTHVTWKVFWAFMLGIGVILSILYAQTSGAISKADFADYRKEHKEDSAKMLSDMESRLVNEIRNRKKGE